MSEPARTPDGTLTIPGTTKLLQDVARHPHCYAIPPAIKQALDAHAEFGHEAGSFVEAVLRNYLSAAILKADPDSLAAIHDIVTYLNELPDDSWGLNEKVDNWRRPFIGGDTRERDLRSVSEYR
mgnify:CR=1 FL=1